MANGSSSIPHSSPCPSEALVVLWFHVALSRETQAPFCYLTGFYNNFWTFQYTLQELGTMNPFVQSTSNRHLLCSVLHQILWHKEVEGLITILRYLLDTNIYFYLNNTRHSRPYNVCAKFLFLSSNYISI